MPLLDEDLNHDFIQVDKEETVASTLEKLKAQGGDDYWRIFVAYGPDALGVLKVGELKKWLQRVGPALFDLRFADLQDGLPEARVRQQEQVADIDEAERMAFQSPAGVMAALRGSQVLGFIFVAAKRADEAFPGSTMGQLYGEYISQAPDARATWQPADLKKPVCPHCNHRDFYRYRVTDDTFVCASCGQAIPEEDM